MPTRTPEEIRASIERNREELGTAVTQLRVEVVKLTDWRGQLRKYEPQVLIGAAAAGFVHRRRHRRARRAHVRAPEAQAAARPARPLAPLAPAAQAR